jgi:hypothetical protein
MFGTTLHTRGEEVVLHLKNALRVQEILCEKLNQRILRIYEVKETVSNKGFQILGKMALSLDEAVIVQLRTKTTPLLCHHSLSI